MTAPANRPTTSTTEAPTTGTLTGTVYGGNVCNQVNHANCPAVANGSVIVVGPDLGPDGRQVPTDAAGHFSVVLPPGTYRLNPGATCSGDTRPPELAAGATVTVTLWCNWGLL